ncbi:diguanylate cyclase [Roseateles sp. BYS87W]|uniref:diguanylate cyclase n=1 Tax=Pelomonas baiyunensis TaxID=3299026 RepID=A0ABW7H150_9BURK
MVAGWWALAAPAVPLPRFERVAADQIPREVVAALAQDRDGFLWVATGDGLVRYDGLRLQPQEVADVDRPAQRNLGWIRALLPGRDGRVWIGTETRGLAVYDPRDERIRLVEPPAPDAPPRPTLMALAEDLDGAVWAGGQAGGLARYDPAGGPPRVWAADGRPGSLPDDAVLALRVARDGTLWLGHGAGLARRSPASDAPFQPVAPELDGQRVQALWLAADGALWAGSSAGHLVRVAPDGRRLALPPSPAGAVVALAEAQPGVLWVGRASGIELRDAATGALLHWLRHRPGVDHGLGADGITALLVDARGVLWVGGLGLGLQRSDPTPAALWVRGADTDPASALANANVRALLARRDGRVWAATDTGALAVLEPDLRTRGPGPQVAGRVLTLAEQPDGRVWLGQDGVLQEVGPDERLGRRLPFAGGAARRLLPGRDGRLWLAATDGLWWLPPGGAALQRMNGPDGRPLRGEVHALAEDDPGALWVATSRGLLRLAPGANALAEVSSPPGEGLGNPVVIGLLHDRRGRLWLDTAVSGLHRLRSWDGRQARFDRIGERLGATGRPFGANLLEDARGRIWTQMHVYDPTTDRITPLGPADGVRIGMPWFFSFAQLADGRLVFGGTRGLLVVQPEAWQPVRALPRLQWSGVQVDGQPVPVQAALTAPGGLPLPPGDTRVSVDVALLDVAHPEQHTYQYRVDGLDRDWRTALPGQRRVEVPPLRPGLATLRLRAADGAPELRLPLRVAAPWWQRPWALLGGMVLLAGGLAGLVRWRTRHLLARQRELEAHVRERTQALEEASLTDPLTGLRNRRYLLERIEADCAAALRRAGRPEADLLFFLMDIDHFKTLNDRHGHAAGDAVLTQMRERLQAVFRAGDALVRWGGEEFLVVARDSDRRHAGELAERLRQQVAAQPFESPVGPLAVTVSIGFAAYPPWPSQPSAFDWQDTLSAADGALYRAKSAGRNGWAGLEALEAGDVDAALQALRDGRGPGRWPQSPPHG